MTRVTEKCKKKWNCVGARLAQQKVEKKKHFKENSYEIQKKLREKFFESNEKYSLGFYYNIHIKKITFASMSMLQMRSATACKQRKQQQTKINLQ